MAQNLSVRTHATAPTSRDGRRRVHVRRFALAYVLLALIAAGAVVGLLYTLRLERPAERAWSAWQPTERGADAVSQISDFVSRRYRNARRQQMVRVLAGPPSLRVTAQGGSPQQLPIDGVIVNGPGATTAGIGPDSVMYAFCGLGQNCALDVGTASQRNYGYMLQRIVLELALYTFKYVDGVDRILFFLPPLPTAIDRQGRIETVETVAYLERDDVEAELDTPLRRTLPRVGSPRGEAVAAANLARLVRPRVYTAAVTNTSQGATVLELTPYRGEQ